MSGNAAHRSPWRSSDAIAAAVLVLGTGLDVLAPLSLAAWVPLPARALRRAGQSPAPGAATTQLVVHGPFRRSRHPLYLGLVIALAGLGVAFDMPWWLLLVAPTIVALRVLPIAPEERYLEAQFGAGYRAMPRRSGAGCERGPVRRRCWMTRGRSRTLAVLAALLAVAAGAAAAAGTDDRPEQAVCNRVLEPFAFWLWQRAAGTPYLAAGAAVPGGEAVAFTARDGRVLRGYRLNAAPPRKGFVLVAQGNATLAERLLAHLRGLAQAGYDVVIYDYRGYAGSAGKRRLKAIVGDYRELHAGLVRDVPGERLLYGMSFGGIVLLNVIGAGAAFDRAVIDSTPSRIAGYGCPKRYDPVRNLPADGSRLLLIQGARDRVVPAGDSAELLDAAEARGARVVRSARFAHPFMDRDPDVQHERETLVHSFLRGGGS